MTAKDLLNADMTTISRWLGEGFDWWVSEIVDLVPQRWRGSLMRGTPTQAHVHGDDIVVDDATRGAVTLVLPQSAVLIREVELPVVAGNDVRRMIALDIDRITPFRGGDVVFDTEIVDRDPEQGKQRVRVGAIARTTVEHLIARARERQIEPKAIGVDGVPFDFLAALRRADPGSGKRTAMWWAVAGGLAAANIFLLIYQDQSSLDELRDAVDAQQATVTVAERLRRKVDIEAMRRSALMDKAQHTPLSALAAVSAALPDSAWVHRFEWTGRAIHVTGYQAGGANIVALLKQATTLANAHVASNVAAPAGNGVQGFDVAADIAPSHAAKPAVRR